MTVIALTPALARTDRVATDFAAVWDALDDNRLLTRDLLTRLERLCPWPTGAFGQVQHVMECFDLWAQLAAQEPLTLDEEDELVARKQKLDDAIRELVSAR